MAHSLVVQLLGDFRVEVDGRAVPEAAWRRRRAAALVKILALAPNQRLPREQVIEALWPGIDPAAGGAYLRKAAYHARQALGAEDALVLDGVTVSLLPAGEVHTDVAAFESLAAPAMRDADVDLARRAAAAYAGELLPDDRYEAWTEEARERLRQQHLRVTTIGRLWGRLLAHEPASELAHREIIRERLEAGDRAAAIRQFDRLRTVLREELGVSPGPESVALYERVLAAEGATAPTPAERARALLAWGTVHWDRLELGEAERTAREVRALAVDAGLGRELAEASELLAFVAFAQGRWREVFAEQFLEAATNTPELTPFVYDANLCFSEFALHEPAGLKDIGEFADELVATGTDDAARQARALGLLLRGEIGLFGGADPSTVRTALSEAAALHDDTASISGLALATERLAQAEAIAGRGNPARQLHRRALELAERSAVADHLAPLVYGGMLEAAAPEEERGILDDAEAALADRQLCRPCSMSWHLGAARIAAHAGQLERADGHLGRADEIAAMWNGGPWHAAVTEVRAVLAEAHGAPARQTRALLASAAAAFEAAGRLRDAARCAAAVRRR